MEEQREDYDLGDEHLFEEEESFSNYAFEQSDEFELHYIDDPDFEIPDYPEGLCETTFEGEKNHSISNHRDMKRSVIELESKKGDTYEFSNHIIDGVQANNEYYDGFDGKVEQISRMSWCSQEEPSSLQIEEFISQVKKKFPHLDMTNLAYRLIVWMVLKKNRQISETKCKSNQVKINNSMKTLQPFQNFPIKSKEIISIPQEKPSKKYFQDELMPKQNMSKFTNGSVKDRSYNNNGYSKDRRDYHEQQMSREKKDNQNLTKTSSQIYSKYINGFNKEFKEIKPIRDISQIRQGTKNHQRQVPNQNLSTQPSLPEFNTKDYRERPLNLGWSKAASSSTLKTSLKRSNQKEDDIYTGSDEERVKEQDSESAAEKKQYTEEEIEQPEPGKQYKVIQGKDGKMSIGNINLQKSKVKIEIKYERCKTPSELRKVERQIAARVFCEKGYGLSYMKEELKKIKKASEIDERRYASIANGFAFVVIRTLQKFLIQVCQKPMKKINNYEVKILSTILVNCKTTLSQDIAQIFIKFLKLAYGIEEVQISEEEAARLYNASLEVLDKKMKTEPIIDTRQIIVPPTTKNELQMEKKEKVRNNMKQFWTRQLELQFIQAYLSDPILASVRKYFRIHYSAEELAKRKVNISQTFESYEQFYNIISNNNVLMKKLHKLIRAGVNKVQQYSNDHRGLSSVLQNCKDTMVKKMFYAPEAKELRKLMLRVIKKEELDPVLAIQSINSLNKFGQLIVKKRKIEVQLEKQRKGIM